MIDSKKIWAEGELGGTVPLTIVPITNGALNVLFIGVGMFRNGPIIVYPHKVVDLGNIPLCRLRHDGEST